MSPNKRGHDEDKQVAIAFQIKLPKEREKMKLVKGWKKISNQGGYINENTGQTLIVSKKTFSKNFLVLLFVGKQTDKEQGKSISPEYSSQARAEAFAVDWMDKHPDGMV